MANTQKRNSKSLSPGPTSLPLSKRQKARTSSGPQTQSLTNSSSSLSPGVSSQTLAISVNHTELDQANPIEELITMLNPLTFNKALDHHQDATKSPNCANQVNHVALAKDLLRELAKLETSITYRKYNIQMMEADLEALPETRNLRLVERILKVTERFVYLAKDFVGTPLLSLNGVTHDYERYHSDLMEVLGQLNHTFQDLTEGTEQAKSNWQSSAGPSMEADLESYRSQSEECQAKELVGLRAVHDNVMKRLRDEGTVDEPQHESGLAQDHGHVMS